MRSLSLALLAAVCAAPAMAQVKDVSGVIDLRVGGADGETSWTEGGFGKLRYGGDDFGIDLARAAVVWRPRLGWSTDAYVHLEFDPDQEQFVGVGEAYLRWKPMARPNLRYGGRLGAFYPPVSLEHDGVAWSTTRTITPSVINSWIGEEVKVGGAEGSVSTPFGDGQIELTAAAFGWNDTSGTLLAFRGWAMHDQQITLTGDLPLPTRSATWWSFRPNQAHSAEPFREIDGRAGYYARVEWKMAAPVAIDAMHYDNAGDRVSRQDRQTAWETRFTNIGLRARLAEGTHVLAQAMAGQTVWIPLAAGPVPYVDDVDFASAYVMLDHEFGGHQGVAARLDAFETKDNQPYSLNSTPEDGWALTAAYRNQLPGGFLLMLEGLYVSSERGSRPMVGVARDQEQMQVQSSLRWQF